MTRLGIALPVFVASACTSAPAELAVATPAPPTSIAGLSIQGDAQWLPRAYPDSAPPGALRVAMRLRNEGDSLLPLEYGTCRATTPRLYRLDAPPPAKPVWQWSFGEGVACIGTSTIATVPPRSEHRSPDLVADVQAAALRAAGLEAGRYQLVVHMEFLPGARTSRPYMEALRTVDVPVATLEWRP